MAVMLVYMSKLEKGKKKKKMEGAVRKICVFAWAALLDYKPSPQMSQQAEVSSLISHY